MRQYFGDNHLSPPHHAAEDSLEKEMATHSQYYCLENPMDRGVWSTVHEVAKSQTRLSFPGGSDGKASVCNAGDTGSIPRLGRSAGEGNGNPLQYSCLENLMNRGAW